MRYLSRVLFCVALLAISSVVYAGTYFFAPDPANLGSLAHAENYAWRILWSPAAGEMITGAELTIRNIDNWAFEPNANWLRIYLLDTPPTNGRRSGATVWTWTDNELKDNWKGKGDWIATYTDNSRGKETLVYDLGQMALLDNLSEYAADGVFGFGFDPDCHYYNDGVCLKITTAAVPEPPSGLVVFLATAIGAARFRKPKGNKQRLCRH